jgi:hypothetical protein
MSRQPAPRQASRLADACFFLRAAAVIDPSAALGALE